MQSNLFLRVFAVTLIAIHSTSTFYNCPTSCKCFSKEVFCVGNEVFSVPQEVPWNKTIIYIRNYRIKNNTLSVEMVKSNNVTKSLTLKNLGIFDIEDGCFQFYGNVEFLSLNENNLTQLRDGMFTGLDRLKFLYIRKNRINHIDMTFRTMSALSNVDFSYNLISNLSWIKPFALNQISIIRSYYFRSAYRNRSLSSRVSITLSNNPLSNETEFQVWVEFRYGIKLILEEIGLQHFPLVSITTSYLDLSHNNITSILTSNVRRLRVYYTEDINELILNNNNMVSIGRGAFSSLRRLRTLYLENNVLKLIPTDLPISLFYLHLSNNQITTVGKFTFLEMTNLRYLALRGNKIDGIYSCSFCGLVRLQYLFLEGNSISFLPEEVFMGLNSLEALSLSRNALYRMESGCFVGLRKLKILDLSFTNNDLHSSENVEIDYDVFDPLGSLEELSLKRSPYLANHFLNNRRLLATLKNLRRLDMSHNKITSLTEDFTEFLPRLTSFDVSANRWKCAQNAEIILKLVKHRTNLFTRGIMTCY